MKFDKALETLVFDNKKDIQHYGNDKIYRPKVKKQ